MWALSPSLNSPFHRRGSWYVIAPDELMEGFNEWWGMRYLVSCIHILCGLAHTCTASKEKDMINHRLIFFLIFLPACALIWHHIILLNNLSAFPHTGQASKNSR
jgi:hypothetical protein